MKIVEPHHDGSPLYVSNSAPKPGEKVTLSVRIPDSYPVNEVHLRIYHDGEARFFPLKKDAATKSLGENWWRVKVEMMNMTPYCCPLSKKLIFCEDYDLSIRSRNPAEK